jgi:hypothetical protein
VQVRSEQEILDTLDADGTLDGVPFMHEMRAFCGRRFRVFKRADKICVEGNTGFGIRRLRDTVMLEEVRCDGSGHDGCKRMCMIFWKEAWLKPSPPWLEPEPPIDWVARGDDPPAPGPIDDLRRYECQSTTLYDASEPLPASDIGQYVRDLVSRALGPLQLLRVLFVTLSRRLTGVSTLPGTPSRRSTMRKSSGNPLDLHVGETVVVRRRIEILARLAADGQQEGAHFTEEMFRHCGRAFPVVRCVDRVILEPSGKMQEVHGTVLLQGTSCSGQCARGCARNCYPLWQESWLQRIRS